MTHTDRIIFTVSQLNQQARSALEGALPMVWVEGEISNLARPASGHLYFSLKDASAQVRCAFFRNKIRNTNCQPKDGSQVIVRARVSLYEARGDYQLIVEDMEDAGEGALRRAFDVLKKKLEQEGLFAVEHKKPLPAMPKRIGVITSESGSVIHDIVTTLKRRFPVISILLYPVAVQGEAAARQIAAALELASKRKECDVLIIARGGGSLEDLWPFNEEQVARAIYSCAVPVVSGVGHETDITIADWVADARAPTPTAAAELLSPDQAEILQLLKDYDKRLHRTFLALLREYQQRLDWSTRLLSKPETIISQSTQQIRELWNRLKRANESRIFSARSSTFDKVSRLQKRSPQARVQTNLLACHHLGKNLQQLMLHYLSTMKQRLKHTSANLDALSPLATLDRGYAIVIEAERNTIVRSANEVSQGDQIEARLSEGRLFCTVDKTTIS